MNAKMTLPSLFVECIFVILDFSKMSLILYTDISSNEKVLFILVLLRFLSRNTYFQESVKLFYMTISSKIPLTSQVHFW